MAYAPPSGNVTSSVDMFSWVNASVSNWFFPGVITALFFIIFIKMLTNQNNTASKAFSSAAFICMIIAVLCRVLDFIATSFMSIFIIMTAVGALWMHIENSGTSA